jgi:hypothetical protein
VTVTKTLTLLLSFAVLVLCAARAEAQVRHFSPDRFERATVTDAEGRIQWAEHAEVKCPTCTGTGKHKCTTCERFPDEATKCPDCGKKEAKEAVCHACAGTGRFPDPLEKALCPGCMGAGHIVCGNCPGTGILKVGDDKRWSDCPGCRGDGFFKCPACNGARLVGVASLKPSLKDANAATLQKALKQTDELIKELAAFTPQAKNSRKESKELAKIIQSGDKLYPALKPTSKALDELMKWTFPGANFQGQAEREVQSMQRMQASVDYYLKHQKRMMELALKRAEANEKLDDK